MAFSFSGLAGMSRGYQDAASTGADTDLRRMQAMQAQNDMLGQQIWGNALKLMMGGGGVVGGGQPGGAPGGPPGGAGGPPRPPADIPDTGGTAGQGGGGGAPQGDAGRAFYGDVTLGSQPPQGEVGPAGRQPLLNPNPMASQVPNQFGTTAPGGPPRPAPMVPGMMSPQPMMPQQGGQPPVPPGGGGGAPPAPQSGGPSGGAPGGPGMPPSGSGGPPGAPMSLRPGMGGSQGGQRQGPLTLQAVLQAIVRANPNAPPQAIAAGVKAAMPMMTAQAQLEWRELSLALREQSLQNQIIQQNRRGDQADTRIAQTGARDETNRDIKYKNLDVRKAGEERRTEGQQFNQGLKTGQEARRERESESRIGSREKRDTLAQQREERLARESAERQQIIQANVKIKEQQALIAKVRADTAILNLKRAAEKDARAGKLADAKLKIQAMKARHQELIAQWAVATKTVDPKVLKAIGDENRAMYDKMIRDLENPEAAPQEGAPAAPQAPAPRFDPQRGVIEDQPGAR